MEEGRGETLMATGGSCSVSEVRAWINLRKYLPEKNEVIRSLKARANARLTALEIAVAACPVFLGAITYACASKLPEKQLLQSQVPSRQQLRPPPPRLG